LEARIHEATGLVVSVEESDLFGLIGAEREAAISGLLEQQPFPFVIVAGRLACTGSLDRDRIVSAIRQAADDSSQQQ
jgi:hypothetical protein